MGLGGQVLHFSVYVGELKLFRQAGLFENAIGGVTRSDFPIYGKADLREGAVPDFVISFTLPFKMATIFGKDFLTIGA